MGWSKLDDAVYGHRKFIAAGTDGVAMWMMALAYSNRYSTDGFVPAVVIGALYPMRHPGKVAARLAEVGLFDEAEGGYIVHDYLHYNPSAAEVEEKREAERIRKAAQRRAGSESSTRGGDGKYMSHRDTAGTPNGVPPPVPPESQGVSPATRPSPVPSRLNSQSSSDLQRPPNEAVDDDDGDASLWTDLAKGDLAAAIARGETVKRPEAYLAKVAADRRRRNDREPQAPPKPAPEAREDPLERTAAAAAARRAHDEANRLPDAPDWSRDEEVRAVHRQGLREAMAVLKRAP